MANFCPACGSSLTNQAVNYCPYCGAQINASQTTATYSNGNDLSNVLGTLVTVSLIGGLTRQLYYYGGRYFLDPYCRRPYGMPHRILHYHPVPPRRFGGPRPLGRPMWRPMGPMGGPRPMGPMGGPRGPHGPRGGR